MAYSIKHHKANFFETPYKKKILMSDTPSERFTGRVKWFNNKTGYGFITIADGITSGNDVFVHHSSTNVDNQQYKYLVQGEYVEFSVVPLTEDNSDSSSSRTHSVQASEVCGIKGGKLMCETRNESQVARSQYRVEQTSDSPPAEDRRPKPNKRPMEDRRPVKREDRRPVKSPREVRRPTTAGQYYEDMTSSDSVLQHGRKAVPKEDRRPTQKETPREDRRPTPREDRRPVKSPRAVSVPNDTRVQDPGKEVGRWTYATDTTISLTSSKS